MDRTMTLQRFALFAVTFCQLQALSAAGAPSYLELAEYYAPVIFQQAESEVLDYITRFDFDGDLNGSNNWKNAYRFSLPAYVYYAVIESTDHYFITYAFFHPRDYTARPFEGFAPKTEHENDMEGCTLAIEKDGTEWGRPLFLETLSHDKFYHYSNRAAGDAGAGSEENDPPLIFLRPGPDGHHREPAVFVEAEGHGVLGESARVLEEGYEHPGIVYRFTGDPAEVPSHHRDQSVSYGLIPIEETLWPNRYEIGPDSVYCCGHRYSLPGGGEDIWGDSFNGPIGGCAARPPWGWDQADDGPIAKGDWFRDPLSTFSQRPNAKALRGSYVHNPYLEPGETFSEAVPLCQETSASRNVRESIFDTLIGIAGEIFSGGLEKEEIKKKSSQLFFIHSPLLEWAGQTGLEAWKWEQDTGLSSRPIFSGQGMEALLQVPLVSPLSIQSPALNAPARYFNQFVIQYRSEQEATRIRLSWELDGQSEEEAIHSAVVGFPATDGWETQIVDLTQLDGWDPTRSVTRIELGFETAAEPISWIDELIAEDDTQSPDSLFEIRSIVFDREAFSDTFSR